PCDPSCSSTLVTLLKRTLHALSFCLLYSCHALHRYLHSFPTRRSSDLADNRPLLVMRSNLWASGYDVDGTDQTSLGQFHQHHSQDRKSGSAGMPRPISYAVFCLKKKMCF